MKNLNVWLVMVALCATLGLVGIGCPEESKETPDSVTDVVGDTGGELDGTDATSQPDGDVTDIASLQATLTQWADDNAEAVAKVQMIIGFGYDNAQLAELRHPTRDDLDADADLDFAIALTRDPALHGNDSILEAAGAAKGDVKILAVTALTSLDRGDLDFLRVVDDDAVTPGHLVAELQAADVLVIGQASQSRRPHTSR